MKMTNNRITPIASMMESPTERVEEKWKPVFRSQSAPKRIVDAALAARQR
jgi:hypothetical protein